MIQALFLLGLIQQIGFDISVQVIVDIDVSDEIEWQRYKKIHNLEFPQVQENLRRKVFLENMQFIRKTNTENKGFSLIMNKFGHLSDEEFKKIYLSEEIQVYGKINDNSETKLNDFPITEQNDPIEPMDWREMGVVADIKDQMHCAAGWAFAAVCAVETQYAIMMNQLVKFSEQDLIDCSEDGENMGCERGSPLPSMIYFAREGIFKELDIPYRGDLSYQCNHDGLSPTDHVQLAMQIRYADEYSLTKAIKNVGPTANMIDASSKYFRFYHSGILYDPDCKQNELNHGVTVVGYDEKSYIVRNSWGTFWGDKGYIRMSRLRGNNCGIASNATYVELKFPPS